MDRAVGIAKTIAYNMSRYTFYDIDTEVFFPEALRIVWEYHLRFQKALCSVSFSHSCRRLLFQRLTEEKRKQSVLPVALAKEIAKKRGNGEQVKPWLEQPCSLSSVPFKDFFVFNDDSYNDKNTYLENHAPQAQGYNSHEHMDIEPFLEQILSQIDPLDRDIVIWYHVEGFSYEEIARHVKLSILQVRYRLQKAMVALKKIAEGF